MGSDWLYSDESVSSLSNARGIELQGRTQVDELSRAV
jgi:hypothetical protein